MIESKRKEKLAVYDQYLRNFQYSNALDAVLRPVRIHIFFFMFNICLFPFVKETLRSCMHAINL